QTLMDVEFHLAMVRSFQLAGVVVSGEGEPVAGAVLSLEVLGMSASTGGARTDLNGRFQIGNLPSGTYYVSVSLPRPRTAPSRPPGIEPHEITISDASVGDVRIVVTPRQ